MDGCIRSCQVLDSILAFTGILEPERAQLYVENVNFCIIYKKLMKGYYFVEMCCSVEHYWA